MMEPIARQDEFGTNLNLNPKLNPDLIPKLNPNLNPDVNPKLNLNPKLNPDLNPDLNLNPNAEFKLGFRKVCRTEEDAISPFPGLPDGVLEMKVKEGSKIRNLMGFALTRMQDASGLRQVVFSGSGRAVTKTITCAEIMKRKMGGLHQITKLRYRGLREIWESRDGGDAEVSVHRTLPSISILLSKDPLDPLEPGYQPPERRESEGDASVVEKRPEKRPESPHAELQAKRVCV